MTAEDKEFSGEKINKSLGLWENVRMTKSDYKSQKGPQTETFA